MKIVTMFAALLLAAQVQAKGQIKNIQFEADGKTFIGKQKVSTYGKPGVASNYAFETSIQSIQFVGVEASNIRNVALNHKDAKVSKRQVNIKFETNYSAQGELVTLSCDLKQDSCSLDYFSPKANDHDAGLPGSGRINAFDKYSLEEAIESAKRSMPVVNFLDSDSSLVSTYAESMDFNFDRKGLETVMGEAGICRLVFHPGGVYGPGNTVCVSELAL